MIVDITNEVLTKLKSSLPTVDILTSYPDTTPNFPCVTLEEINNSSYGLTKDSDGFQHSVVSIEINIFTTGRTRMSKAKEIRNQIDNIISMNYGMSRDVSRPTPNYLDTSIYKYTMRYSAIVNKNKTIYRGY